MNHNSKSIRFFSHYYRVSQFTSHYYELEHGRGVQSVIVAVESWDSFSHYPHFVMSKLYIINHTFGNLKYLIHFNIINLLSLKTNFAACRYKHGIIHIDTFFLNPRD